MSNHGHSVICSCWARMLQCRTAAKVELRMRSLADMVISFAARLPSFVDRMERKNFPQEQWHDGSVHSVLLERRSYYGLSRPG